MKDKPLDSSSDQFRSAGYAAIDWIADYLDDIRELPVLSSAEPGSIEQGVTPPGDEPASWEDLLSELETTIVPGITHWNHPRFHAYFSITGSQAGILGELLSAAFNVNGMLWRTSPAATELEELTVQWVAELLGFPSWFGIINDTASISTFLALAAARERAGDDIRRHGLYGAPPMTVYCSEQAHSSVDKAVVALGLGLDNVRRIPTDERLRMSPSALAETIESDVTEGRRPIAVVPTAGTTGTAAIDPLGPIIEVAGQRDLWVHVDAAYGGAAAALEHYREEFEPLERADSVVVNPHKWLFVPIDCSIFYTKHPETLRRTFSLVPSYLETPEQGVTNFMDYGIQLGRRFRSIKLWLVLARYGTEAIRERIADHIEYAEKLGEWIDEQDRLELIVPVSMSVVVFHRVVRRGDGTIEGEASDEATEQLMEKINDSGISFVSHARIKERLCIRVAIGNGATVWSDIEALIDLLKSAIEK